ncbi:hypothetical protein ACLK14_00760 [Escherichia coli]
MYHEKTDHQDLIIFEKLHLVA